MKTQQNPAQGLPKPRVRAADLKCNDHIDDSLSVVLCAIARALDTTDTIDYNTAYCRSSNAFAPMIDKAEECTSHWACEARLAAKAFDNVASSLGLQATQLELPRPAPDGSAEETLATRRQIAAAVQQAIDGGAVVVTTGGWDIGFKQVDGQWKVAGPHGFVFWGAVGVVTQADPATGVLLGAHTNGHEDNPSRRRRAIRPRRRAAGTRSKP